MIKPLFAALGIGVILGIVPGLLLGIPSWHLYGAVALSLLSSIGYIIFVTKRSAGFDDIRWVALTYLFALVRGIGMGVSIWFFGTLIESI